jgi:alpha-1,3-glucan synthase
LDESGGSQPIWLVYQNDDHRVKYSFNCSSNETAFISPFPQGTVVKNTLAPYDEFELEEGPRKLGIDGYEEFNGCAAELELDAYGFKAYVPKDRWLAPLPMVTNFLPGHDTRILSTVRPNETETVDIELHFSEIMDCNHITSNLLISSTTINNISAQLDQNKISCAVLPTPDIPLNVGGIPST